MAGNAPERAAAPGLAPLRHDDPATLGRFRLVGRVGSGGMGAVFAARPPSGGQGLVAVKVVHDSYAADDEFRSRFRREVELVRRVQSPHVPRFHGADPDAAHPWMATEYVPGRTLRQHVAEHGNLTGGMLLGFAAAVAEALRVIHAHGVMHRDLKPGNIILAASGPKILDFGIARGAGQTLLTQTGAAMGTPGWVSPELYQGAPSTTASDVFAWGGLVGYAGTGREPFGTGELDVLAYRTVQTPPDLQGLPEPLRSIVLAAMDKDPARRPDAAALLHRVHGLWAGGGQEFGAGDPATRMVEREWVGVHDTGLPAIPERRRGRRTLLLAGGTTLGMLLVGAIAAVALLAYGGMLTPSIDEPVNKPGNDASAGASPTGENAWPPAEARQEARFPQGSTGVELRNGSDNSTEAVFDTVISGQNPGQLTVRVYSARHDGDTVTLTVGAVADGAGHEAFSGDALYVRTRDAGIEPEETPTISRDEDTTQAPGDPSPQVTKRQTLTFPGAPEQGLLAMRAPEDYAGNSADRAPVGVCYDTEAGGESVAFSADYEDCT